MIGEELLYRSRLTQNNRAQRKRDLVVWRGVAANTPKQPGEDEVLASDAVDTMIRVMKKECGVLDVTIRTSASELQAEQRRLHLDLMQAYLVMGIKKRQMMLL